MEPDGKDQFIEEIDKELRTIDAMLKQALSKTEALLKDSSDETKKPRKRTTTMEVSPHGPKHEMQKGETMGLRD